MQKLHRYALVWILSAVALFLMVGAIRSCRKVMEYNEQAFETEPDAMILTH